VEGLSAPRARDARRGTTCLSLHVPQDVGAHLAALVLAERAAAASRATSPPTTRKSPSSAPRRAYPAALALLSHFRGKKLQELVHATAGDLQAATPWLTLQQRRNVLHYFAREFENGA
jgi:hypothetical protein